LGGLARLERGGVVVATYVVEIIEPVRPGVSADTLAYSGDNSTWPTADGGQLQAEDVLDALANIVAAEIYEPVHPGPSADTTLYTADGTVWPTADGGIIEGATETVDASVNAAILFANIYEYVAATDDLDAEVVAAELPVYGGGYYPRPRRRPALVYGYGYGVLPRLEGEAHGIVGLPTAGIGSEEDDDDLLIALMLLAA
jgi:hypothetical protein